MKVIITKGLLRPSHDMSELPADMTIDNNLPNDILKKSEDCIYKMMNGQRLRLHPSGSWTYFRACYLLNALGIF
jgi:hypothetical protein